MAVTKQAEEALNNAREAVKEAIRLSLEDLMDKRDNEHDYINLWVSYGKEIGRYFQTEAERTENRQLARYIKKNLTNSLIFS